MNNPQAKLPFAKSDSWKIFNQISPQYDFLNHVLSFGLDIVWRKKLSNYLNNIPNQHILDVATGTGDVIISLVQHNSNVATGTGIDLAEKMLEVGRKKINIKKLNQKIKLSKGDATQLQFEDNHFDATTIAFGIRNIPDPVKALKEMHRVLKPEGCSLVLEFSLPANPVIKCLHIAYLRFIVPIIGFIFSGHYKAYKYLNQTIEEFPYGSKFCQWMEQAGFTNVHPQPLFFGIATIYKGEKKGQTF